VLPPDKQNSLIKMDQVTTGYLEGVMDLPLDGQWLVRCVQIKHGYGPIIHETRGPSNTHNLDCIQSPAVDSEVV
jgi:hypothetical protein